MEIVHINIHEEKYFNTMPKKNLLKFIVIELKIRSCLK